MKYVKAQDVLPEEIIEILQKYVDEILKYSKNIKTEPP